jgi:hypothetical protein
MRMTDYALTVVSGRPALEPVDPPLPPPWPWAAFNPELPTPDDEVNPGDRIRLTTERGTIVEGIIERCDAHGVTIEGIARPWEFYTRAAVLERAPRVSVAETSWSALGMMPPWSVVYATMLDPEGQQVEGHLVGFPDGWRFPSGDLVPVGGGGFQLLGFAPYSLPITERRGGTGQG